jgi:hypothetical protein
MIMNLGYTYHPTYQKNICSVIQNASAQYRRVLAGRVDLRFSEDTCLENDSAVITRFIESLKAKLAADLKRKEKRWGRALSCDLHYAWAREFGPINAKKHYHVLLLLNKDVYYSLGDFDQIEGNLSAMIRQAWCGAIKLPFPDYQQLVHFPQSSGFYIDRNASDFFDSTQTLIDRANYLAKFYTKQYGDGERSFGCSR